MGTIEFKVNGQIVSSIDFFNEGGSEVCKYDYDHYDEDDRRLASGTVSHRRSNGIETLAYLILNDMRGE